MIIKKISADYKIIPSVEEIAREMTSSSQVMIIIRRIRKLNLSKLIKFGFSNLKYLPKILQKDFAAGVKVLCELDILRNSKIENSYALHSQMTDMAVSLKNYNLISFYFDLAKYYKFKPLLITYNVGPLINMLSQIRTVPDNLVILTPINKSSWKMNPDYASVFQYLEDSHITFANYREK